MKANKTKQTERLSHIKSWRESGLTIVGYCKKAGIKKEQFYYWRRQYQKEKEIRAKPKGTFINLNEYDTQKALAKVAKESYKFIFPNGIILQVTGDLSLDLLKTIKDA